MKIREITFGEMKKNIKGNIKIMIMIFAVCVAIGIVCGLVSAKSYDHEEVANVSQLQEHVDLDTIEKDGGYYYNCMMELKEKKDYIAAYLQYFEQVDISNESREALYVVQEEIDAYKDAYDEMENTYKETAPTLFEQEDAAIEFYNEKIKDLQKENEEVEKELEEVVNGNYTDAYKEGEQTALSEEAKNISEDIETFEGQIQKIDGMSESAAKKSAAEFDGLLTDGSNQLNNIIDDFNNTLSSIAEKENYEIVYNKRLIDEYFEEVGFNGDMDQEDILSNQKGKAIVYAQSIAGLDIPKERFLAFITFFILFGIALAVIVSAVKTPQKGKEYDKE